MPSEVDGGDNGNLTVTHHRLWPDLENERQHFRHQGQD